MIRAETFVDVDTDELVELGLLDKDEAPLPMADRTHLSAFGWAWDDPNAVEVEA